MQAAKPKWPWEMSGITSGLNWCFTCPRSQLNEAWSQVKLQEIHVPMQQCKVWTALSQEILLKYETARAQENFWRFGKQKLSHLGREMSTVGCKSPKQDEQDGTHCPVSCIEKVLRVLRSTSLELSYKCKCCGGFAMPLSSSEWSWLEASACEVFDRSKIFWMIPHYWNTMQHSDPWTHSFQASWHYDGTSLPG